jgi:hypothetical protein
VLFCCGVGAGTYTILLMAGTGTGNEMGTRAVAEAGTGKVVRLYCFYLGLVLL